MKKVITVISPCYNEETIVERFYSELKNVLKNNCAVYDHWILFVDDGSSDGTLDRLNALALQDECVLVCSLSRNFGHQVALSAGLDFARGDAVILMDSDLQHPPEMLPELIRKWEEGYQVVSAVRQQTADSSWLKRFTSNGFYTVFNLLSDVPLVPGVADFTLLTRETYRALRKMPERHRFLRGMISWMGFRRACVNYVAAPRHAGHSKYSFRRMLALASDAIFSFTARPIRLATRLGLGFACLGLVYLVYIVVRAWVIRDVVPGWPSVACLIIILGGMQLFFVGLIGEYVARVFDEVKARPRYFLRQRPMRRRLAARSREGEAGA